MKTLPQICINWQPSANLVFFQNMLSFAVSDIVSVLPVYWLCVFCFLDGVLVVRVLCLKSFDVVGF